MIEPNNQGAPTQETRITLEERLESLGHKTASSLPADMEARVRRRFTAALAVPQEDPRSAMIRRVTVALVTIAVLWTLYLSFTMRRAQGRPNSPAPLHSASPSSLSGAVATPSTISHTPVHRCE